MTNLKGKIEEYKKKFADESARVRDEKGLAELRNEFLSRKKGCLTSLFEEMKGLSAAEKPGAGQLINEFKDHVQEKLALLDGELSGRCRAARSVDLTLPGRSLYWGAPHPVVLFQQEIENIFLGLGFAIEDGPEIEIGRASCRERVSFGV